MPKGRRWSVTNRLLLIEFANGTIFNTVIRGDQTRLNEGEIAAMSKEEIEEGAELLLDFEKLRKVAACGEALVPAIAQDVESGDVLFVGYANEEALNAALATGKATFWSTSRNELWRKGESSGDVLDLVDVSTNCEQNSLLYRVRPRSGVCHTVDADGNTRPTCYYRRLADDGESLEFA